MPEEIIDPQPIVEPTTSDKSEPTSEKSETVDLTGLQNQLNGISAQLRKGEVDPVLLEKLNASVTLLSELKKPVETIDPNPELVTEVASLTKRLDDSDRAFKVQEIKTTYGLSESDLDLISDPDLEKFEKRAKDLGDRNKLQTRRESRDKIPDDLKDNEFVRRMM